MKFCIRIDLPHTEETEVNLKDLFKSPHHIIVSHILPTGNPHYHIIVDDQNIMSQQTLRNRIKRKLGVAGTDFSLKIFSEEYGAIAPYSYLFNSKHGNIAKLVSHNLEQDFVDQCIKAAAEVTNDFNKRHSIKNKAPTVWDLSLEVQSQIGILPDDTLEQDLIRLYAKTSIDILRKHNKPFCEFSLRKLVCTSLSHTGRGRTSILDKFVYNYFPR